MTNLIVLTVFEFADRVSRMREAQRHYQEVQSLQAQRIMQAQEAEVDGILFHLTGHPMAPEFREFAATILVLRREQNAVRWSKSPVAAARLLSVESSIDACLAELVRDAKELNALLADQDDHHDHLSLSKPIVGKLGKGW